MMEHNIKKLPVRLNVYTTLFDKTGIKDAVTESQKTAGKIEQKFKKKKGVEKGVETLSEKEIIILRRSQ